MKVFSFIRQTITGCWRLGLVVLCVAGISAGCAHKPPTIAHTHIGHAITAFEGTPEDKGLFVIAEDRAASAGRLARALAEENTSTTLVRDLIDVIASPEYGLKVSLSLAESHITFAATSEDATANVKTSAQLYSQATQEVVKRCDLTTLLANDLARSNDASEKRQLVRQIKELVAMIEDGKAGGNAQVGTVQLREMIDAMVAGENPPYQTVDRWYLFHLVRLPECDTCWAWRKWANSSNRGY